MADLLVVLALLGAAIVMFAINKPRLDAVALIMLVALPFTGVLTMGEALAGFSDLNIVLIAALFVLGDGAGAYRVAQRLGDWLIARAGQERDAADRLADAGWWARSGRPASSTAVTAIFIPVALRISQSTGIGPGRLMMPLSFAALISGMMTLVATAPNLVVNGELERHGVEGFGFFSFTPFGLPILILGNHLHELCAALADRPVHPVVELGATQTLRPGSTSTGWRTASNRLRINVDSLPRRQDLRRGRPGRLGRGRVLTWRSSAAAR